MFWERLSRLCDLKNCKPNTVAKAIELSNATATKWKNGAIPSGNVLIQIADYFDCSVDYLLGRSEYPKIADEYIKNQQKENVNFDDFVDIPLKAAKGHSVE